MLQQKLQEQTITDTWLYKFLLKDSLKVSLKVECDATKRVEINLWSENNIECVHIEHAYNPTYPRLRCYLLVFTNHSNVLEIRF